MLFNRDVNASNNIWKISQAAIHGQPRPGYLSWQQPHPPPQAHYDGGPGPDQNNIEQAILDYEEALALAHDAMHLAAM
jgi:hypothetical protein